MKPYGEPTTEPPPPPKPILRHFLDARKAFVEMYGAVDIRDMSYLVSDEAYSMLLHELDIKDMSAFMSINYPVIRSIYGIALETSEAYSDRQCALLSPDPAYHFEIPEPRKVKSPPKPDPAITPSYPCDFGAFDFVGQMISFLWWAWQRVVSSKKYGLRYSFIIGFVDRMFASTISYDSYGQSSFHELWLGVWLVYGIVVAAWTASSWSKHWNEYLGEQYKPKRKANGEQMLMLGDLFEGYEGVDRERGTDHTLI